MKTHTSHPLSIFMSTRESSLHNKGFALIATISVMVLLVLVALALLSLSTVELRGSSNDRNLETARANARMGLMLAIAELQTTSGADTRITAPADVIDGGASPNQNIRQLTGVWRSWEGLNHDRNTGFPTAPNYQIKERAYDPDSPDTGRFVRWLISDESQDLFDPTSPPSLEESTDTVPLLAEGTLADDSELEVHIVPTEVVNNGREGSLAWWIQGENTKLRLKPTTTPNSNLEATEQLAISPGPSGQDVNIDDTSDTDKTITRNSLAFIQSSGAGNDNPTEFYHDLTTHSRGLLTNVANGGWKRDLSLFTENFGSIPEGFSAFTLSPGNTFDAGKSHTGSSRMPLVYPWVDDWSRGSEFPACMSWTGLVDFATQYKRLSTSGDEIVETLSLFDRNKPLFAERARRMPLVSRIHNIISLSAEPDPRDPSRFQPSIVLTPVITLWNPYSVAMDCSNIGQNMNIALQDSSTPVQFDFRVDSTTISVDLAEITASTSSNTQELNALMPFDSPAVWLPGEVRIFSPNGTTVVNESAGQQAIEFEAGFRPGSGLKYALPNISSQPPTAQMSIERASLEASFGGPNVDGIGVFFTTLFGNDIRRGNRSINNMSNLIDAADAPRALGEEIDLTFTSSVSLSSLASSPQPILSSVISHRFARDTNSARNNIVANGIHNMNPTTSYMVSGDTEADRTSTKGRFDQFSYEIQVFALSSLADPGVPSGIDGELEGYLGSGFGSIDGLSNLVLMDIPTRPLLSIGDLQNFNVNACNRRAPFTLNALGNSTTSPFIESDQIRTTGSRSQNHGYDHSFAMNHAFQDDWFVSGVAPETSPWSSNTARNLSRVYEEHLSGEEPLVNHYFKPEALISPSIASSEASDFLSDNLAWSKVAAELEVEGMFNINSTSELAWAMLLKRNFAQDNPGILTLDGSTPGDTGTTASLRENDGSPFPRTTLTSHNGAGNGGDTLLSQPPRFTDTQILALAREIVLEIKQRGPFLSLSEFYNRQLSDDPELARSGAVESALRALSENSGPENPFTELQAAFRDSASTQDFLGDALSYPFPEAAEGNPAYGFPGWTRQADVLRPISSILSARDDTFTIRAYGASKDADGNVLAEVWCEAVVQRKSDFVNGDDKNILPTEENNPFGRRYEIQQFRWLNQDEI